MRPTLIIIEGAQGVGKTTLTNYIRNKMPYTNLYRLSGHSDSSENGYYKSQAIYDALMQYIKALENQNINLVFDRTFFSEEVYTRLGYKKYSFTPLYYNYLEQLNNMDYDIYLIILYLNDKELFKKRLNRKEKAKINYAKFDVTNSINQQKEYLQLANEIKVKGYKNIRVLKLSTDTTYYAKNVIDEMFINI